MRDRSSIELIRMRARPPGHDAESYAAWQIEFGRLMAELRRAGRRVVGRTRHPTVLALLDGLQRGDADPVGFGLVEHVYEFAAFHVPGPSGCTMVECALDAAVHLPEQLADCLPGLADSHWELFEVVGLTDAGGLELRRLFDDAVLELHALERAQPLVKETVVALRVFDAGGFLAAPVALVPEQDGLSQLVSLLECEQPGPFDTRSEYMRYRGSALILQHALRGHRRRLVAERRPMPEPQVSLAESELDANVWQRLDAAFSLVERTASEMLTGVEPLVLELADAGIATIERNGPSIAVTLFETAKAQYRWQTSGQAKHFVRAWRAGEAELFAEDVALLEELGLEPRQNGATVAIKLGGGLWKDVDEHDIERLVEVCQRVALRIQMGGEMAA